ncbi:MAG: hypothetical protein A2452_08595 [Candidatus Firestonebacteria bacterium RIFOXYC2_FULL_39_67]|nr:MAG: hypothetical protein A2536_05580 [Candidatus Firestonebacteria bacterium RIFOXYD2_FULL_39_29]OGF56972.1 MAG: hypothetical protein A2452_08595 [Candidatus Firestonebacteria bacterium RIFOXYC2_FULL_39_67]
MKNKYFSTIILSTLVFFTFSCRTIQLKDNSDVVDTSKNINIVQSVQITPENIILTPEVKPAPEKPPVIITPEPAKPLPVPAPKTAMETLKAAPAKVIDISNKIAEKVKVETKNSLDYWPLLLILFVVIIFGYFMYDTKEQKPVKRTKKKVNKPVKTSRKSKK